MSIGPFLRREYVVSIERRELFRDRLRAAVLTGTAVVSCLVVWDWKRWDRTSVAGAASFAHVALGLVVAVQACISVGFVLPVAGAIASERDGKSLDALLATRLSSPQIILGVMAAGLFRFANGMTATLPVVVLLVYLGGVDPWYAPLACLGLASTGMALPANFGAGLSRANPPSRSSKTTTSPCLWTIEITLPGFRSVERLIEAIRAYIDEHNDNPKPFVWTAKAEDILEKVRRARAVLDKIASE